MSACCGFMFVVNLCSLPLLYFVRVFWVFSLPKFSSYPVSFFFLLVFLLSFIFPIFCFLFVCVVLFASFVRLLCGSSVTMDYRLLCFSF